MEYRTIMVRVEIEDSDVIEQALFKELDEMLHESMKDFSKLPNTSELYENDETFRLLCAKVKTARKFRDDYIQKIKNNNFINKDGN